MNKIAYDVICLNAERVFFFISSLMFILSYFLFTNLFYKLFFLGISISLFFLGAITEKKLKQLTKKVGRLKNEMDR